MGEPDISIKTVLVLGKYAIQVDGSHFIFCRAFFALGSQRAESTQNVAKNNSLLLTSKQAIQ